MTVEKVGTDMTSFVYECLYLYNNRNPRFPSDFSYQFHTEDTVYYKTEIAEALDSVQIEVV